MANLRVDKITSTETFETTGSVQFGNDNALKIAANSGFDLTSNDFTMECWVYMNSVESFQTILMYTVDGTEDDTSFQFDITSTQLRFVAYVSNSSEVYGSNFSFGSGTWYHVAATRTNGLVRLFVDGDLIGTHPFTSTIDTEGSAELNIGYRNNNGTMDREVFGHLTNIRIINGKALYTDDFKPPMRELEVTPETTLLCCQSKTDASLEKTSKTITVLGDAVASELTPGILTPVPKAGAGSAITGSVEFTGNNYLIAPDSSDFEFGTEDFTIECWINASDLKHERHLPIIQKGDSTSNNQFDWRLYFNDEGFGSSVLFFDAACSGTAVNTETTSAFIEQAWIHVAVTRQSGTFKLFFNGILETTDSSTTNAIDDDFTEIIIGFNDLGGAGDTYLKGYISNLRVVKGTALYTDSFIPPTRELKKVPGTALLACQDPDNPLTEATGKTITGFGDLDQSYGAELVTNGQFTADSDWTKGTQWTISGGSASITDSPDRGSDSLLTQDASSWIQEGQMYRVGVDWSFSSGDFDIRLGGDSTYTEFSIESSQSSPYFFNIEAGGTNDNLAIIANQHAVGDINSISVEKLPPSKAGSNFTPQVGDDRKVTFEGVTKINTENYFYLPTGNTESRNLTNSRGDRGIFSGGHSPTNTIDYITISSLGNAQDFGDLTYAPFYSAACASSIRGLHAGGATPTIVNTINYLTIMSMGNAFDFGDLTGVRRDFNAFASRTRGVFAGGTAPTERDTIDFVTIATTSNAIDFGNLSSTRQQLSGSSSPTRGIIAGGFVSPAGVDTIEYVTIASTGNAIDFGNLATSTWALTAVASQTRSIIGGGAQNPGGGTITTDTASYITISSTGNAIDFGDLTVSRFQLAGASNSTRGAFAGGYIPSPTSANQDTIDYVTIASTGNARDFGNLTGTRREMGGCSNGHGGLG